MTALPVIGSPVPGRSCQSIGCSACCRAMGVDELAKPAGRWCSHADPSSPDGGCGIYRSRPPSCRDFHCQWLGDPGFPAHLDPRRTGVVVTLRPMDAAVDSPHPDPDAPLGLSVREMRPGAWRSVLPVIHAAWLAGAAIAVYDPDSRWMTMVAYDPQDEHDPNNAQTVYRVSAAGLGATPCFAIRRELVHLSGSIRACLDEFAPADPARIDNR